MTTDLTNRRVKIGLAFIFFVLFFIKPLYAGEGTSDAISWRLLISGLVGGLALFLYGIEKMSDGMKKSAGNKMRSLLAALTRNRIIALIVGAFVTMVIQSSSATTVMLVSFVQAGLMSFSQTLGVILGADMGTTVTAQLIAFKLTDYALLMIAAGFGLKMLGKTDKIKDIGEFILGFGILFFGMKLMSDTMKPLRTYPHFIDFMKELENPMMGLLVGTMFTALIQSSAASIGVIIVLAQQGLITLEAGIPIIFGANIGTCITAGLASIGTSRDAKRVALAHVLFKIVGVMLFIFWIPSFASLIQTLAEQFGSSPARQIANAHTIFNVSIGVIFLPFTAYFAKLILWISPEREEGKDFRIATWHLDEASISTPALAIDLARSEISRMANILGRMLRAIIIPYMSDEKLIKNEGLTKEETALLIKEIPKQDEIFPELTLLQGISMREEKIDFLDEKIHEYLVQIARKELSDDQTNEVYGMMSISNDLESIGDLIHRNMVPLIAKKRELEVDFSEEGKEELMIYHQKVCKQINLLKEAFSEINLEKAQEIMATERKYLDLESQYRIKHLERLRHNRKESIETHEVHMELMDLMKQIIVYSSNIAKTFLVKCKAS